MESNHSFLLERQMSFPIDEPSKLPDFHRLLTKSLNFATAMETLLNITLPICALAWLIKEIRLLIAEVKGRR